MAKNRMPAQGLGGPSSQVSGSSVHAWWGTSKGQARVRPSGWPFSSISSGEARSMSSHCHPSMCPCMPGCNARSDRRLSIDEQVRIRVNIVEPISHQLSPLILVLGIGWSRKKALRRLISTKTTGPVLMCESVVGSGSERPVLQSETKEAGSLNSLQKTEDIFFPVLLVAVSSRSFRATYAENHATPRCCQEYCSRLLRAAWLNTQPPPPPPAKRLASSPWG
ncbi:uncharacterized protein VDAG_07849 [Verticillium dahliae VdLs.17]|uniref:Uncharacterized protein n=1 Tax=Verticillium dahliae (strain VdLs.17 / ATCC MYA-4575 / FGSC 10137) TaxID=498257 RepID=G2XCG7_VERDV|nr:uncharacterized protein VDAG_07849 [Verticillium dahliae VdLs.17]EGY16685.1 hypothetical protein VDAG_07849 [Verticillium dahliae VdLs.17]KAH6706945.1 hypothetical protein EV126DRAFT_439252 [Verticillium dahliae]